MAVVVVKSSALTNRDATPQKPVDLRLAGRFFQKRARCLAASDNSVGSTYTFFSLPSNAVVFSLLFSAGDFGTTTAPNVTVGLSRTTRDGGAVVDADFFSGATLIDVITAAQISTEIAYGNVITVANAEKRLWEHLALAADPQIDYDVVATIATADFDTAGVAMMLECFYKLV